MAGIVQRREAAGGVFQLYAPQCIKRYFCTSRGAGTTPIAARNNDNIPNIEGRKKKKQKYLTKSLFQLASTCPRKLLYSLQKDKYPRRDSRFNEELYQKSSAFLQSMADEGRRLEKYCQLVLFPNGIEVGGIKSRKVQVSGCSSDHDHALFDDNYEDLVKETRALLEKSSPQSLSSDVSIESSRNNSYDGGVTIFEGAVRHGPYFIRADILHKPSPSSKPISAPQSPKKQELWLMEIKSKSYDSTKTRDEQFLKKRRPKAGGSYIRAEYVQYIRDLAFQKMVLQDAYPNYTVRTWLILPDKSRSTCTDNLNKMLTEILGGAMVKPKTPQTEEMKGEVGVGHLAKDFEGKDFRDIISASAIEKDECLVSQINVDDLVDMILTGEEKLTYPGSATGNGEDNDAGSFHQVVQHWADIVTEHDYILHPHENIESSQELDYHKNNTNEKSKNSSRSFLSLIPPPIGPQCASCEYRMSDSKNDNSDKSFMPQTLRSGFFQCWLEATDTPYEEFHKKNKQQQSVVDLWYGTSKMIDSYIRQKKFFLNDLTTADLGLLDDRASAPSSFPNNEKEDGGKRKEKQIKEKSRKLENRMSRAMRQWYQVLDATSAVSHQRRPLIISDTTLPTNSTPFSCIIHKPYIQEQISKWSYPYHFIDFETCTPTIPYFRNTKPFEMIAFQFSHHVLHEDGEMANHKSEFLYAVPGQCPNESFLRALANSLGSFNGGEKDSGGTVFRWGTHENTILSNLLKKNNVTVPSLIPTKNEKKMRYDLSALLVGGANEMVDLMKIAQNGYFVSGNGGSVSIKSLLKPTMTVSSKLRHLYGGDKSRDGKLYSSSNFTNVKWWQLEDNNECMNENENGDDNHGCVRDPYSLLELFQKEKQTDISVDSAIADGGSAATAYHTLQCKDIDPVMRSSIENSLLRYCELDTLAMAMIVQAWQGFLEEES